MKDKSKENIILKPAFVFSYAGVLGYIIFFLLRPSVDLTSGTQLPSTNSDIIYQMHELNQKLGFDSSLKPTMAVRSVDRRLWDKLKSEMGDNVTPHSLNKSEIPINKWRITFADKYQEAAFLVSDSKIFSDVGISQIHFGDDNRVKTLHTQKDKQPYFIESGTSYQELASIITDVFNYQLANYSWDDSNVPADTIALENRSINEFTETELPESGVLRFDKVNPQLNGPTSLELTYTSTTRTIDSLEVTGISIDHFSANYGVESSQNNSTPTNNIEVLDSFFLIAFLIIMVIIVLITGLRQVFRGRVEWKRSLLLLILVTLMQFAWTTLYYWNSFYLFIDESIAYMDLLQQFFISLIYGLYAALAYISWESLARDLRSQQIPVMDAFWSGKFFQKQLGAGILSGYGIAGFYLGIIAVYLFTINGVYAPLDSMTIGVRDINTAFPSIFYLINSSLSALTITLAQVGIVYCLLAYLTKNEFIRILASIFFTGLSMYGLSRLLITDIDLFQNILLYLFIAVPLVLSYRYFGLISAFFSLFVMFLILRVAPLLNSVNSEFISTIWIIGIVLLAPFIVGLIGLRGASIKSYKEYVPEYEAIKNKQLRSEKELAIAKESQYALMPTKTPEVPGFDIRGFFVPSYEVGGDFYDYEVINDENGKPKSVALAIVDVSGKAMKSAFNAVFTSGLLLSRIYTDRPETILTEVNPILCKKTDIKTFVTCQLGLIQLSDKKLSLANAGHCLPLLKRDGKTTFIQTQGPRFPLGMKPDIIYTSTEVPLQSNDILLLYSDGLAEAINKKGNRLSFADIQILVNNLKTDDMSASEICNSIKKFILEYSNYELADDTTVICVKVN